MREKREGIKGKTVGGEKERNAPDYQFFKKQRTKEVEAAREGARLGGATEGLLKDAHDFARDLGMSKLSVNCKGR
ncbi:M55 family metallopeptidase, partial [Lysinibacillus agricola]|uniref:M55 family metallopeptidase n=1 Tax=Lysinibacillus agricola TaxID=2590012 RepID=UPI003C261E6F